MRRFMTDEYAVPNLLSIRRGDLFLNRLVGGRHHLYLALSDSEKLLHFDTVIQDKVLVLELDEQDFPPHPLSGNANCGPVRYFYALRLPKRFSPQLYRIPRDTSTQQLLRDGDVRDIYCMK